MNYSELVGWLFRLSEHTTFKNEMNQFLNIREQYAIKIDRKKGTATFEERKDPQSPELYHYSESFDEDIIKTASGVWAKTATLLHEELPNENVERIIDGWIEKLEIAQKLTETNQYYYQFTNYLKALQTTVDRLNEYKSRVLGSAKKRGNPNWKGPSAVEKATIIRHSVKLLQENPDEYKPRKGAHVSERLKVKVKDDLVESIPGLTVHKVARVLLDYYANQ